MDDRLPDPAEEIRPDETAEALVGGSDGAPVGGDKTTEDQLDADNAVEEDQLKSLDPDDTPA
ncbi:hypothetical protein [Microbacterium tenebrionis]|uniref:Uncharacterized protein n=1 Tax=Microbacterium tenebrionis TaxID=2830665 RepID=A0A9X1LNU6_9MICO|nr:MULTISPECIES: hypothetical protein [Microbacterium]MCC2028910.1 hypothetical protein [Microbacterium tenebrionis]